MNVRTTEEQDWMLLKNIRLAALLDTPTAFGVSYQTAINNSDEQWKQRASSETEPRFWLAFNNDKAIGMIGAGIDKLNRYNLIAMWVEPESRRAGVAECLVNAVKTDAFDRGFKEIYLDVSPDNLKALRFYMKHGFFFIDEKKPLESHPNIQVQTMKWELVL
ncbi:IAA acetyltransferase/MarR transcriptional regulatory protein [Legionella quinlivanii]|uniref:IAA acetyltransferase/MarR transcriptional regulatory protein n=1 Tax=Legionella quinlivanii TaxID=45073 RepID=A0A0W0XN45_9GAMM|nr:GNAT family N-acetyltransferase [Legionella quinlivanii]KTD46055.1 IAA acetyltransferase/MarR transcriptional regulatory protein [Legionella quinlivanii]SEG46934.1 Acetyltransferase (GNAT) family protein [Legionella quinlivanii DSM 21216]STY10006.1 acyl-CoA N-acyltransferase [Legionella quinlivanii]